MSSVHPFPFPENAEDAPERVPELPEVFDEFPEKLLELPEELPEEFPAEEFPEMLPEFSEEFSERTDLSDWAPEEPSDDSPPEFAELDRRGGRLTSSPKPLSSSSTSTCSGMAT